MLRTVLLASALTLGLNLGLAAHASAEILTFKATMKGTWEVPTNSSKGAGKAQASIDTATKTLTYKLDWKDLSGPATMAHFHSPAGAGANAGVMVPLGNNPASPIKGTATLTVEQIDQFKKGLVYVNVHTAEHPTGEIRGQMIEIKAKP